jgi:hypothetical protein
MTVGQTRKTKADVAVRRAAVVEALKQHPAGVIASVLAQELGIAPPAIGNLLAPLADEGAIGRRIVYGGKYHNKVTQWFPDPAVGCEKPQPRPRRDPLSHEERAARSAFNDAALAREHRAWIKQKTNRPRYNPWERKNA